MGKSKIQNGGIHFNLKLKGKELVIFKNNDQKNKMINYKLVIVGNINLHIYQDKLRKYDYILIYLIYSYQINCINI